MILPCDCGAKLKIDNTKIAGGGVRVRCPRCGTILTAARESTEPAAASPAGTRRVPQSTTASPTPGGALVLVAHENEEARAMVRDILVEEGFNVDTAADGTEALQKAIENKPQVLLVDVGLPGIYGFELCGRLKDDDQTNFIKVILLTSAYDVSRYKRTPASLYGADDYIEKHEITEYLTLKIRKLLYPEMFEEASSSNAAPVTTSTIPSDTKGYEFSPESLLHDEPNAATPESSKDSRGAAGQGDGPSGGEPSSWLDTFIQQAQDGSAMAPDSFTLESSVFQEAGGTIQDVDESDPEAVAKAKRFARIIVSDIALYNQEAVQDGIQNGTFFELLQDDITEGRQLYEKRVPEAVRSGNDFYQDAFDNFIAAQKRIVR